MSSTEPLTIGEFKSQQRGRPFDELFRHQFVLSKDNTFVPASWECRNCAGWTLGIGDALAVHEIRDAEGHLAGFVLGIAWDSEGKLVRDVVTLDANSNSEEFPAKFETFAIQLGGRFVALMLTARSARLYGDPASDYAWVYDAEKCIVGSSVSVLASYPLQPTSEYNVKKLLTGKSITVFEHTIDRRIKRGISNHYLDLASFKTHRFWPRTDIQLSDTDAAIDKTCNRIAEKLAAILRSLTEAYSCILPVTGGHDSRVLLACGSGFLDNFTEFSGYRFHNPTRKDSKLGRELLQDLGRPYKTYFKAQTTVQSLRDFRLKTGWSCIRRELSALTMLEQYPADALVLRGGVVEMLRANQWRADRIGRPPHVRYGLKRLRQRDGTPDEMANRWGPTYRSWLEALPKTVQSRCYDLAAVEHWLPNTLGAYYLGFNQNFFLNPYSDRELIELTMGIDPRTRSKQSAVRKVILAASDDVRVDTFF